MADPERDTEIPINPYWVGGSFLDYCVAQGWMFKKREGKSARYYCTRSGVDALKQFGIQIRPSISGRTRSQTKR